MTRFSFSWCAAAAVLLLLAAVARAQPTYSHLRVAIVGSGPSGTAAAHFIRSYLPDVSIDVFEGANRVGGRVHSFPLVRSSATSQSSQPDEMVEAGASVFHESNEIFAQWAADHGLETRKPFSGGLMGIWTGSYFVFEESGYKLVDYANLLWRYGWSVLSMSNEAAAAVKLWQRIYELQRADITFADGDALFSRLGLDHLVRMRFEDFWNAKQLDPSLREHLVDAVMRVNYGQASANVNSLSALVSLTGSGEKLFSIKAGNQQLLTRVLRAAATQVLINARVANIRRDIRSRSADLPAQYYVTLDAEAAGGSGALGPHERVRGPYDAVVVAAPRESAALTFTDVRLPWAFLASNRTYQVTYATFIVAQSVSPAYFDLQTVAELPAKIFTTENPSLPFTSITVVVHDVVPGYNLYKVFSRDELEPRTIAALFVGLLSGSSCPLGIERGGCIKQHKWHAYPRQVPVTEFQPFDLGDGLLYTGGFESGSSCMEMQAVAGRNAALLVVARLKAQAKNQNSASNAPDEL